MTENRNSLKLYLLGALDENEQSAVERRLFLDDDEFERLMIAEDELLDDYARDALSRSERERFEQHFLCTTERHQKLRFAQALHRHVDRRTASLVAPAPASGSRWGQWFNRCLSASYPVRGYVLAATSAFIALGGPWLLWREVQLRKELAAMRMQLSALRPTEQELQRQLAELRSYNQQIEQTLEESKAQVAGLEQELVLARQGTQRPIASPVVSLAAFVLTPGALVRSPSGSGAFPINRITIPLNTRTVSLQLDLEKDRYPSYRATLQTQGGTPIKQWDELKRRETANGQSLQLQLPGALLPAGSYSFRLLGVTAEGVAEKADQFHFQVARK